MKKRGGYELSTSDHLIYIFNSPIILYQQAVHRTRQRGRMGSSTFFGRLFFWMDELSVTRTGEKWLQVNFLLNNDSAYLTGLSPSFSLQCPRFNSYMWIFAIKYTVAVLISECIFDTSERFRTFTQRTQQKPLDNCHELNLMIIWLEKEEE